MFRKTAGTARRYQMQFGREFMADLYKMTELKAAIESGDDAVKIAAVTGAETGWMYDLAYIMAQQADPSIKDELSWLDGFDDINIFAVIQELFPMIIAEGRPSPKNA